MQVWECKIGGSATGLPAGADYPMRRAIERAYREITGEDPEFIFSGWDGDLTESELAVVEDRLPRVRCQPPTHYFGSGDNCDCGAHPTVSETPASSRNEA